MKSAILGLVAVSLVMSPVQARDYRAEQDAVAARVAPEIWDVYEPRTGTYTPSNAYLSAHAVQAVARHGYEESMAGNFFDQVVEIDGGDGLPRVVVAAGEKMVLAVFDPPPHRSIAKMWKFLQLGLTDSAEWLGGGGRIHSGCAKGIDAIWDDFHAQLAAVRGRNQPVWLAGHGLGGSLAVLAAYRLVADEGIPIQGVYTFGQPRVGDSGFAAAFEEALEVLDDGGPLYRVVYRNDIVPRLTPPYVATTRLVTDTLSPYVHFGALMFIASDGGVEANPGRLESLDASLFELKDRRNHEMGMYQRFLYDARDEQLRAQLPKPVGLRRGKRILEN